MHAMWQAIRSSILTSTTNVSNGVMTIHGVMTVGPYRLPNNFAYFLMLNPQLKNNHQRNHAPVASADWQGGLDIEGYYCLAF